MKTQFWISAFFFLLVSSYGFAFCLIFMIFNKKYFFLNFLCVKFSYSNIYVSKFCIALGKFSLMDPLCRCAKKVMFWHHSPFPPLSPVSRWVNLLKKHSDIRSKYYILNNVNMLKGTPFLSKLLKLESLPLETLKTFGHKIDYYFGRIPAS